MLIIENIRHVWADSRPLASAMPPRCAWTAQGSALWQERFPEEYAIKSEVDQLHDELKHVRVSLGCP